MFYRVLSHVLSLEFQKNPKNFTQSSEAFKLRKFLCCCFFLLFPLLLASQAFAFSESEQECKLKDVSIRKNGKRQQVSFPATLGAQSGQEITSACLYFTGIDSSFILTGKDFLVSINDGVFEPPNNQKVKDGDSIRIKSLPPAMGRKDKRVTIQFKETAHKAQLKRNLYQIVWMITASDSPGNTIYDVGPSHMYREISEVLPKLKPGDTIRLQKNAVYQGFSVKQVSGTEEAPIKLTSNATESSERPRIVGRGEGKRDWVIGLTRSHFWHIKNVILEGGDVCLRNEAAYTLLEKVVIRDCHHGVLGTDHSSGSITIQNSEVYGSGGKVEGRAWGHAIYIATDRDRFPGSTFTLKNSFVHGNRGNAVKSRAENTHIVGNWLETSTEDQSRYLIELIGYDAYDDSEPLYGLVENNILVNIGQQHSIRVGGDGTGRNIGAERFANNLFVFSKTFDGTVFRIYHGLGELEVENNTFLFANSKPIFVRDTLRPEQWTDNKPVVRIKSNILSPLDVLYYHNEGSAELSTPYFSEVVIDNMTTNHVEIDVSDNNWLEKNVSGKDKASINSWLPFSSRPKANSYIETLR